MSSVGRNWTSERYQRYERAGLQPSEDRLRRPIPHWVADTELSQPADETWHLWSLQHSGQEIVVDQENSDGRVVFDLSEVV